MSTQPEQAADPLLVKRLEAKLSMIEPELRVDWLERLELFASIKLDELRGKQSSIAFGIVNNALQEVAYWQASNPKVDQVSIDTRLLDALSIYDDETQALSFDEAGQAIDNYRATVKRLTQDKRAS